MGLVAPPAIERLSREQLRRTACFRQTRDRHGGRLRRLPEGGSPGRDRPARALRVPVLFLNGSEDGADPPANVADARRELPNSRTVIFPAAGHGQLGLPCAQVLIADFITRGTATGLDTSCARTAAVQPFATGD